MLPPMRLDTERHHPNDRYTGPRPPAGAIRRAMILPPLLALLMLVVSAVPTRGTPTAAAATDHVIYAETLANGWWNWSWSSSINFQHPLAYSGARAIWWRIDGAWGGLYLRADQAVQTSSGTSVRFALRASGSNQQLLISVRGENGQQLGAARRLAEVGGVPPQGTWKLYDIPLSTLNAAGQRISGIILQDLSGAAQPAIELDEIALAGVDAGGTGGNGGGTPATGHVVYSEALSNSWVNWSWSSTVNLNHTVAYSGAKSIWWKIDGAWGALYLRRDQALQASSSSSLRFALRASASGQQLYVGIRGESGQQLGARRLSEVGGDPPAGSWKAYDIPLSSLGAAGQRLSGIVLQDARGAAQPYIEVDEVSLVGVDTSGGGAGNGSGNCLGAPAYPEIRPGNTSFNQTAGRPTDPNKFHGWSAWRPYYEKVNGACTGTTEQILEWAVKKWGFDQLGYIDLAKAIAVVESWWRQTTVGVHGEVGALQVNPVWPDWEPARTSTAYAADYAMAVIRSHYDGASWLGDATKGNLRDAVAAWECGCAGNGWNWYAQRVWGYLDSKPWKRPGQPPEWF